MDENVHAPCTVMSQCTDVHSFQNNYIQKYIYTYILNEFQSFSDDEVQATGADRRLDAQYKLDESHWPLHVQLLH